MKPTVIVRLSDMKPVLECWDHELIGLALKPGFASFTSLHWLQGFNRAVALAGGMQPTPDLIRAQF